MLNIKNVVVQNVNTNAGAGDGTENGTVVAPRDKLGRIKHLMGMLAVKSAAYLRLCATKNWINRAVDYHYLVMAVTDSTEPRNDIDYIHPVVKPAIDYSSAVITKGLCPNGEIEFEFVPETEEDFDAAHQATNMVSYVLNQQNDPHKFLREWVQDACMHKNGMMMVTPVREAINTYREIEGTLDQLKAFEVQAGESGLTATRQSRRKVRVDVQRVQQEVAAVMPELMGAEANRQKEAMLNSIPTDYSSEPEVDEEMIPGEEAESPMADDQEALFNESVKRNTIYKAKYKLTGYNLKIKMRHIQQHYWVCNPNTTTIQEMPYCGFYEPMTIQEAYELHPDINLEEFRQYAEYNQNGAYQAGSVLNNLAIHGRDSVPTMGIPVNSASSVDPDSRQITILTCWDRYDIDGDGELELVEICCSGPYIIYAKEVEFIPVANMNPKPLPGNFFGMSIGESVIPMQEYATSMHRAEIQLGLLQSTPRLGVKPDRVDFEMLMDGEAAIFVLDSKFDPATDVYSMPVPGGNIQFIDQAMNRMSQDTMNMIGMTQPSDLFNPQIMDPGNSGVKLQTALTPSQLIQDDTVKNSAEGLKELIYLTWRTLVQYGDDYGVKKLAQKFGVRGRHEFVDYETWDDLQYGERKQIHISLALGMMSEENRLQRIELIKRNQVELYQKVEALSTAGTLTPEMWKKIRKPYEESLYALGIKDADQYLPTDQEVVQMIKQGQDAQKNKQPSPDDQKKLADAKLSNAKTIEIEANLEGTSAERQLEYLQIASGHSAAGVE